MTFLNYFFILSPTKAMPRSFDSFSESYINSYHNGFIKGKGYEGYNWKFLFSYFASKTGGVEVAGWTVGRNTRVRFPAYPHRVWALWWQGGKRRLRKSRCPCQGRPGTLKTPSCPWRWVPGSRSKFGNLTTVPSLYSWNVAKCDVKPQPTNIQDWS